MKFITVFFAALCLLIFGYYIGATKHENIFSDVKWTDIGTLLVTFFGFSFGFFTYFQWLNSKRKEDAYLAAKKYIASVGEIEEYVHELMFQYNHICPAPGVRVESKDISVKRIEHLNSVYNYLYQARRGLYKSHRELGFWNVNLTERFAENYKNMNELLDNISVVCSGLNNQLFRFIENNMENISSVISYKNGLMSYTMSYIKLLKNVYNVVLKPFLDSVSDRTNKANYKCQKTGWTR